MNECIFDIDPKLLALASEAENECREMFEKIDSNAEYNGQKVLKAFIDNRVSEGCLKGTTGYGYGDMGRDTIDKVFAQALGGDDALVRHTFVNGTHALSTALFGVLRSGDTMLACTGKPYDTLEEISRGNEGILCRCTGYDSIMAAVESCLNDTPPQNTSACLRKPDGPCHHHQS